MFDCVIYKCLIVNHFFNLIDMKKLFGITLLALMVVFSMTGCKKNYTITVKSNNDAWGTVTGSGTYKGGETATLSAIPAQGYYFNCWNDGNTENPRKVVVNGNAEFIATFSDTPGGGGGGTDDAVVISDAINANTTWTNHSSGVDYIIEGYCYIEGNALLTIEPGTTIMFTGSNGTIVVEENAGLRMVGTSDKPITLTGPTNNQNPGAWRSVEVKSKRNDNQFEYVNFINGGSSNEVVYVEGKLSMKHCSIVNSASNGAALGWDGVFTAFENNAIQKCAGYPITLNAHFKVNCLGTGNTYTNNTKNMIIIDDYWFDEANATITFTNQAIPYYLPNGIHVGGNSIMKVNAGVEFVMAYGKEVAVDDDALIQVEGTSSQKVSFRGLNNENGYWEGLDIDAERSTNGGSYLNYCQIFNAGMDYDDAALSTDEDTRLVLNNVTFNGSNGYGLEISIPVDWDTDQYIFSNYHVTATGLNFVSCAQGNIYETNKDQVFSNWPGNKQLARK